MKKSNWLLIILIGVLSITLIGISYAYFRANILGNKEAKENTVTSGTMELTFVEKDGDKIYFENAQPGDSASKTFTVENTGTLDDSYTYNIKLTELETTFQKEDLKYNLVEYTDDTYEIEKTDGINAKGFINKNTVNEDNEMYLAVNITRPEKKKKHYYKLTVTFENLDVPQDYNQEAEFTGKINVDDNVNAKVYEPPKPFTDSIVADNTTIFTDESGNIRYAGANPDNYVWFNCDDYNGITQENAASEKHCEKWRIIGLFKDIEKENSSKESLVKIVRNESIGETSWNYKYANDWTNAFLQNSLNNDYLNSNDIGVWITSSKDPNYKSITNSSIGMIENVKWYLGGNDNSGMTAAEFYTVERGDKTYQSQPTVWPGKVGLIYPSDYGYASGGGVSTTRDVCLAKDLNTWDSNPYKTDCADNDWLKPNSINLWTLMPYSNGGDFSFFVTYTGIVDYDAGVVAEFDVRPSLYLSSKVKIAGEVGNGSEQNPYILVP